jgi:exosome complex component RRP41
VVLSELLPRSSLLVTLTLLSADGSARAAALNAALLALADAGVPLRDTCGAACAALLDGCPCVDPSRAEEGQGVSQLCLALLPATQTLPLLLQEGARCSLEALPRLLEAAQQGAQATAAFMRRTLVDRAKARAAAMHVC